MTAKAQLLIVWQAVSSAQGACRCYSSIKAPSVSSCTRQSNTYMHCATVMTNLTHHSSPT